MSAICSWQQVEFAEKRNMPFRFDLATKFTLHRDSFELDDLVCKLPHSEFDLRAELASFARPDWTLHYRGRLSLADVRRIFRAPTTPDAIADFSGQAHTTHPVREWFGRMDRQRLLQRARHSHALPMVPRQRP